MGAKRCDPRRGDLEAGVPFLVKAEPDTHLARSTIHKRTRKGNGIGKSRS